MHTNILKHIFITNFSAFCRGNPSFILVLLCVLGSTWFVLDYWKTQAQLLDSLRLINQNANSKPIHIWTSRARNITRGRSKPVELKHDGVYFVKVHKTASTSVQMILNRYGAKRGLKFGAFNVPDGTPYPQVASPALLYEDHRRPNFRPIDIMHESAIYDPAIARSYMRTKYKLIGSIREPLTHISSLIDSLDPRSQKYALSDTDDKLEQFLKDPDAFSGTPNFDTLQNAQAKHYGLMQHNNHMNESGFIETIDKTFDMILITERLDESLLLMKRKFGWTLGDIMYLSRNVRAQDWIPSLSSKREGHIETMHREYSPVDYLIYEYFSHKLQTELDQQPSEFWQQLLNYKAVKDKFSSFCTSMCGLVKELGSNNVYLNSSQVSHLMNSTVFHVPGTLGEDDLTLTYIDCVLLAMSPSSWQTAIKTHQYRNLFCSKNTVDINNVEYFYNPATKQKVEDKQGNTAPYMLHRCNEARYVAHSFPDRTIHVDLVKREGSKEQPFCS